MLAGLLIGYAFLYGSVPHVSGDPMFAVKDFLIGQFGYAGFLVALGGGLVGFGLGKDQR